MMWAITLFPYARTEPGLGKPFTEFARKHYIIWATCPVFAAAVPLFLWRSVPILLAAGLAAWSLARWLSHKLGGLTGDNYGAICELVEALSLMVICSVDL